MTGMTGVVAGATIGAIIGAAVGAFVVGMPGVAGAIIAMVVGVALGGYAGAIIGSFFGDDGTHAESGFIEEMPAEADRPTHSRAA